ncbi:MAG: SRPBCC family protein [Actinomycetota bacterium]
MPAATFTHSVASDQAVAAAWAALQKPETWAGIGPVSSVSDPTYGDDGTLAGFNWVADLGGKAYKGIASTTAYSEPERFDLTMDTSEIAGDVVTTIEPSNPGCNVTVAITFRTKGMLSAMFFPAIKQALASGFPQQIEDLVAEI